MAIPSKKDQQFQRREPAYKRLTKSPALARMWSDGDLAAISPDDPMTNDVLSGAIAQATESVRPLQERKDAALARRREARTPAGKAAASLLGAEQPESESPEATAEAEQTKAQAQALVEQLTPEELAAVEEAMLQRVSRESEVAVAKDLGEWATEQAAAEASHAETVEAVGFDADIPVEGELYWPDDEADAFEDGEEA